MSNMEDDSWRFSDEVARKQNKEVGVYGGDLVPRAQVKSLTGVNRGEELFHRPELYRPWRTATAQSHAEVVIGKEQEIEALTRKCTELRSQCAVANRDLQRAQAQLKHDVSRLSEEKDITIDNLTKEVSQLQNYIETSKVDADHQHRLLKMEHETETQELHNKMKTIQEQANEYGATYFSQMQEVKAAATREVELIQQLCNARTAELSNELAAANDSLRKLHARNNGVVDDLQDEMSKREERCLAQLGEQEKRWDKMRDTLHLERQSVENQRDKALHDLSSVRSDNRTLSEQLAETERRYKDWNVRVLSDLDQLHTYYKSIVDNVLAETRSADGTTAITTSSSSVASVNAKVADVYLPSGRSKDGKMKDTMDTIVEKLQQLTVIKQQHSEAMLALKKRNQMLEVAMANSQEDYRRQTEERDSRLARLHTEVSEAKSRQDRLEAAFKELQGMIETSQSQIANSSVKLQFFADDLNASLASSGSQIQPPRGKKVALVATTIAGGVSLWEKDPLPTRSAITMLNDALRLKMKEFGGYEAASDGDSMLIAFQDVASAVRFSCETQAWILQMNWSQDILAHHCAREESAIDENGKSVCVFRGLRVGMGLHYGEVEEQVTNLPTGINQTRVSYYGRTVLQLLHIASFAAGGQVVASAILWDQVKENQSVLGPARTIITKELGEQRLSLAQRADGKDRAYSSTEAMSLVQLAHHTLSARRFQVDEFSTAGATAATASNKGVKSNGPGPVGIVYHMSPFRRLAVETEVQALRNQHLMVTKGVSVAVQEMDAVVTMVTTLGCKLRDAQIHGKVYSQTDIVAHVAAVDRVLSRSELIKADVFRLDASQRELQTLVKSMEDILIVHTKVSMTEDEFKKRIEMVQERAHERVHEASLQNDHKIQQIRNSSNKVEHTNQELRNQLMTTSVQSLESVMQAERKKYNDQLDTANGTIKELRTSLGKVNAMTKFDKVPRMARESSGSNALSASGSLQRRSFDATIGLQQGSSTHTNKPPGDEPAKSDSSPTIGGFGAKKVVLGSSSTNRPSSAIRRSSSATAPDSARGSTGSIVRSKLNERLGRRGSELAAEKVPLKVKPVNPEFKK